MDLMVDTNRVERNDGFGPPESPRSTPSLQVFHWEYISSAQFHSVSGMEVRAYLQDDVPFGGTSSTATFFMTVEDDTTVPIQ